MAAAHAPGKLVICGEYAVLAGAPAIAAAVDVRAHATVLPAAGETPHLLVAGGGAWPFAWQHGVPRWRETPAAGQGRVLEAVAATLAAAGVALPPAAEVGLDTRAFLAAPAAGGAPEKLGLGSSAAVVVALAAALLASAEGAPPERARLLPLCLDAHRRFQDGRGSGVDVAAAVHGGVVALAPGAAGAGVRTLAWPAGLAWVAAWSGSGASTTALVGRFERFRADEPARFARHVDALGAIAADALAAWERADVPALLRALADYDDALRALDDGARIGIYTPAHLGLAREAQAAGAVYKVSGAGGGDFGIAFADSAEVVEALRARWAREGLVVIRGAGDVEGVLVTP